MSGAAVRRVAVRRVRFARREGFVESGRACGAVRLHGGGTGFLPVLAWRAQFVSGALRTSSRHRGVEKSSRARLAFGLLVGGECLGVGACRALSNRAEVGSVGTARRNGFVESVRTRLALGLGRGRTGLLRVLARRALGVGGAFICATRCF